MRITWKVEGSGGLLEEGWATGELFLGERVYGRFTQVETREGSFPICLELRDIGRNAPFDGIPGALREPGSTDPDTAIIWNPGALKRVSRFE